MDDVLGRLFDYLEAKDMYKDTYVFLMSDNGSELLGEERKDERNKAVSGW